MLVVLFFSLAAQLVRARPTPILTARQTVVTNANGVTQTMQQNSGSSSGLTIGATVAVIIGFVLLILLGIWLGSWKRKRDKAMQKVMVEAHQEAKNAQRLTMMAGQHGPTSSVSSINKVYGKGSTASLAASSSSSFGSAGVLPGSDPTSPPNEGNVTLHHPSPRTPSILVQSSLLPQHSDYPPSPPTSNTSSSNSSTPETRRSRSFPPTPETLQNRTSYYSQQPARPSPLSNSVILPPSDPQSPTKPHERAAARPPVRRKSSAADLIITVPSVREEDEEPYRLPPPGLENGGHVSPRSFKSDGMGKAL